METNLLQAPKPETCIDFYRMIWQLKIHTIVCLVDLNDKEQCAPYFERRVGKKVKVRGDEGDLGEETPSRVSRNGTF